MLTKFSAETRSYVVALMAMLLMLVVPLYALVRRHLDGARLLRVVTMFFVTTLPLFAVLAHYQRAHRHRRSTSGSASTASWSWRRCGPSLPTRSTSRPGQRLFVVIALGANLGALAGAKLTQLTVGTLSPMGADAHRHLHPRRHAVPCHDPSARPSRPARARSRPSATSRMCRTCWAESGWCCVTVTCC